MSKKEEILSIALGLFAKNGFDATSMSDIAKPLNISKAALYKHFESKQQIFDLIIHEANMQFKAYTDKLSVHFIEARKDISTFQNITGEDLADKVISLVKYTLHDDYIRKVRHMITLEQFRTSELSQMYNTRYVYGLLDYHTALFEELIKAGVIKEDDSAQLALYFCAPIFMYIGICDRQPEKEEECISKIRKHAIHFFNMTHV